MVCVIYTVLCCISAGYSSLLCYLQCHISPISLPLMPIFPHRFVSYSFIISKVKLGSASGTLLSLKMSD